jgi:uncharacterized protein (DUF2384 family)
MSDLTNSPAAQIKEVLSCASLSDDDLQKALGVDGATLAIWKRRRTPLDADEGKRLEVLLSFVRVATPYAGQTQLEGWLTMTNPDLRNLVPLDRLMIEPSKVQSAFLSEVKPLIAAYA